LRLAPLFALLTAIISTGPALLQEITPNRMRGVQHAVAVLAVNLIGYGLGPLVIALFTDKVLRDESRLAISLSRLTPLMLVTCAAIAAAALGAYRSSHRRCNPG
jgi:MFS family permease